MQENETASGGIVMTGSNIKSRFYENIVFYNTTFHNNMVQ